MASTRRLSRCRCLVGLILNAWLGWWWADPLASLVLVYYGIREGIEARRRAAEL